MRETEDMKEDRETGDVEINLLVKDARKKEHQYSQCWGMVIKNAM